MSIFIDRHRVTDIDPAVRYQMQIEAQQRIRDASGATPLSHWIEDGTIYCVLHATDEQAVCSHHRERGLDCDDMHEMRGMSGKVPLTDMDRRVIVDTIKHLWHAQASI
jgi:hypothetical protein